MKHQAAGAACGQHAGHDRSHSGIGDADGLRGRPRRVRQRAKKVEGGLNAQFATGRSGMPQRRVVQGREQKDDAGLVQHLGLPLGAQIEHNQNDLCIFLRDPQNPKPHEPDVNNVMRLCDVHNIPLATNLASAELLIKSLDRGDLEWREMYK